MEELEKKYKNFANAYKAFQSALNTHEALNKQHPNNLDLYNLSSAGVIQHFELAYETAWKFLKIYLYTMHQARVNSPKAIFDACYEYNIIPIELVSELTDLVDVRNITTHVYDQEIAHEVIEEIEKHKQVLGKILNIIKLPENKN